MTKAAPQPARDNARAAGSKPPAAKLSRAERNERTRQQLFDAARKVVGQFGYAEASVARITTEAGVAQGTFYNYFATRQELLDQLLPDTGKDMLSFIGARTRDGVSEAERETDRFRAFFDYLNAVPEFQRILNEAEQFAPAGHHQHMDTVARAYARLLRRARDKGEVQAFSDAELEVVVQMLLGARGYLSQRYGQADPATPQLPDHVISAYAKLLAGGLFRHEPPTPAPKKRGRA